MCARISSCRQGNTWLLRKPTVLVIFMTRYSDRCFRGHSVYIYTHKKPACPPLRNSIHWLVIKSTQGFRKKFFVLLSSAGYGAAGPIEGCASVCFCCCKVLRPARGAGRDDGGLRRASAGDSVSWRQCPCVHEAYAAWYIPSMFSSCVFCLGLNAHFNRHV